MCDLAGQDCALPLPPPNQTEHLSLQQHELGSKGVRGAAKQAVSSSALSLCAKDTAVAGAVPRLSTASTQPSPQGIKPSLQEPVLPWCPLSLPKLHDLHTKPPLWRPRRYTQLPLPSPCGPSESGMEHCKAPWPHPASPFNSPTAQKHHQQENNRTG